jgi:type I restriction enzyme M protein
MLDTETKRRIDTARDILVGKVPDPKSQVEQITIALIYKFMDDMDAEAEEMGGKRKFFTGKFASYGWAKLMSKGIGGHELIGLYGEGISTMPQNPGIPQLFRDIFKNAYLPYRDPETLKSFLKIINEFTYDHSERLGDAFEYMLSVLGSQGDAGQFRTPRHIIDFIVAIIDPKKSETVLDPACGTAGFLISSFKHILKANIDARGRSTLTPDDKGKLATNFKGYDISPDMVRLSLVNLYLHGFTDPHIFEYDTLTSEERWNEYADVILANPPFMSPKGGIKPHKRFSIQAKRSEVLFVDYMAEHLTPTGRAGIIVPEGVIFQSQTAYKALRKMLVENSLVAVISLPAGCFNPYSGVKTSILILDKSLAKHSDSVAYFKVENDGYGLGSQRREIDKNDLPQVKAELGVYLQALRNQQSTAELQFTYGLIVPKEKIAANGDYNLSGERYREGNVRSSQFPWVELGDITLGKPQYGSGASKVSYDGEVRYIRITDLTDQGELKKTDMVSPSVIEEDCFLQYGDLLVARSGSVGRTYLHQETSGVFQYAGYLIRFRVDPERALSAFVFHITQSPHWSEWIIQQSKTGTISNINAQQYSSFRLPLPPLEVQQEIVTEIEGYQKVIDGARAVLDNYRPHIPIYPDWPEMPLGEVCRFIDYRGKTPEKTASGIPLITAKNVREGYINPEPREYIAAADYDSWMTRGIPQVGDVLITMEAPLGNVAEITMTGRFALAQRLVALCPNRELLVGAFLKDLLLTRTLQEKILAHQSGTTVYGIKASVLKELTIPVPPLDTQQAVVAEIEAEQALVAANRELIACFEKKIQATLARIWDEEEPASPEA